MSPCFNSDKPCKYFNEGKGTCPFGESCLYKHGMCHSVALSSFFISYNLLKIVNFWSLS